MKINPYRLLADTDVGIGWYILRGWLLAFVPSLLLLGARIALGHASLRPDVRPDWAFAAYSIAAAPVIETALMLALAWLLARTFPRRLMVQVVLLAATFALVHAPGGGSIQAIAVFWPFLVYAAALVAWRSRSPALAFLVTASVHALFNASFLALGAFGPNS